MSKRTPEPVAMGAVGGTAPGVTIASGPGRAGGASSTRAVPAGARSRVNQNTEPCPGYDCTPYSPPINCTSLAQIDSPRPLPP